MPVYLCQAGCMAHEPWRHGIQVYLSPFPMDDFPLTEPVVNNDRESGAVIDATSSNEVANWSNDNSVESIGQAAVATTTGTAAGGRQTRRNDSNITDGSGQVSSGQDDGDDDDQRVLNRHHLQQAGMTTSSTSRGTPIRRIRHAEVVLVDDVCIAYGRHWLRLRWPGHKGGFAGYIALGKVNEPLPWPISNSLRGYASDPGNEDKASSTTNNPEDTFVAVESTEGGEIKITAVVEEEDEGEERDGNDEDIDPNKDEEPQDNVSTLSAEPFDSSTYLLKCLRTGLVFPSSVAMKLLSMYDDGLSPPVSSAPLPSEAVFCRICREGLHDDADDDQPSPALENDNDDSGRRRRPSTSPTASTGNEEENDDDDVYDSREPVDSAPSVIVSKGPVQPHPTFHPNSHAAENPMLSPCECSGSMAFVHYLCVEQWRCRSRHPEARQGLNCETCGKPYALPPPSARPASVMQVENEDWLDAMPPHVMAALRQPHIWWQIGAAIVRRRWLRPVAPILMSPVVALYCRARRLLKKKGVARRRWACSLCRRRARWKCVRCLRSYYCSRQCQNVSWHIVHKHVCYKPSRWAWSVVVYGIAAILIFPGILRDPLMYDLGLAAIPLSFYVMAILGGGLATTLKKSAGLDLRGRTFEMVVLLCTLGMFLVLWGLIGAFFGKPSGCYGILGNYQVSNEGHLFFFLKQMQRFLLGPAQNWFLMWDRLCLNATPWLRKVICMHGLEDGCFEHLYKANAEFLFDNDNSGRCASDAVLVSSLLQGAGLVAVGNHLLKRQERHRRAGRRPAQQIRPHQD